MQGEVTPEHQQPVLRDLGDGLIVRRATPADIEPIIALFVEVFGEQQVGAEVRHVMSGVSPIGRLDLFTLVEDTRTGKIVSAQCLLAKTCAYGGIPFPVGQPEFVATHPAYRRRGLIRAQMEAVHAWSEARGDLMQIIAGIPNYYRQFGYEMALDLDKMRIGFTSYVPKLKEGEPEPYRLRPATLDDVPLLVEIYTQAQQRYLVASLAGEAHWRAMLLRAESGDPFRLSVRVIATLDGAPLGYVIHQSWLRGDHQVVVFGYELIPGVSWLPVTYSVLRYLCAVGEEFAAREGKTFGTFNFQLGVDHPVYAAVPDLLPRTLRAYAWYVRIPDIPGFVRHIAPVLERRLAGSLLVGYSGELKISFYRDGLRLVFEQGRLATVDSWLPEPGNQGGVAFPGLTFLQALLGYRSLDELEYAFPDCLHRSDEAQALIHALFPKQVSCLSM